MMTWMRYGAVRCTVAGVCAAALLALTACGGRAPMRPLEDRLEPPRPVTVRPGDVIAIEFWQQKELSGERIVDQQGRIHLPLLRGVEVTGLAAEEIRQKLTRLYSEFYSDPLLIVNVRLGVSVTGAVQSPGRYTVDPAFGLFDLLGLAGGLRPDGKESDVQLWREGQRHVIDLDEALRTTDPELLRLQSGDWIYVPRRFWTLQRLAAFATLAVLGLQIYDIATR